jgi:hypothetical protein
MGKLQARAARRRRIGRVSVYPHRRRWWVYYREHGRPVRKAVAADAKAAEQVAAQINLELTASAPTLFSFRPVSVAGLQKAFIDYHEHVVRSSLAELAINARTAEPRTPTGNPPHLGQQLLVISGATLHVSLRPPRLLEHPADATLRNSHRPQAATHLADRASPPLGAHQFPWAASFRISMSKAWFATSFLSRAFSC